MQELRKDYTIIIVTHNMQQAARVSDDTGFMLLGGASGVVAIQSRFLHTRLISAQKTI